MCQSDCQHCRLARPHASLGHHAGAWAAAETLFYLRQCSRYRAINVRNPRVPADAVEERIQQFMTLKGVIDFREFLSGWFMNAPFEELLRENVLDFVAYGFWCALNPTVCAGVGAAAAPRSQLSFASTIGWRLRMRNEPAATARSQHHFTATAAPPQSYALPPRGSLAPVKFGKRSTLANHPELAAL